MERLTAPPPPTCTPPPIRRVGRPGAAPRTPAPIPRPKPTPMPTTHRPASTATAASPVSLVGQADAAASDALQIGAIPGLRTLRCRLCTGVNPRCICSGTSAQVHPYRPANRKAERDDLRTGEGAEQKTIVLGADKL